MKILTDFHMCISAPLMVEKGIRSRICHAIHIYAEANNIYVKNYDKHKN